MNKGWISINRKIQSHWLWEEKREFSKLEAWLDILLTVNHSEQKVMIKNTLFTVKRGDSIKSLETWGSRWNWNKSKVRRFLKLLESDSMIVTKNESKTTRLTVCKYDSYQDTRNVDETIMKQKRNTDETQMTPNNNDNNNNNENNDKQIIESFDLFWSKYPNKVNKKDTKAKFLKLPQKDIDKIMSTIDNFISYKPFKDYNHPHPKTYLNQKRWNDEIETETKKGVENPNNEKIITFKTNANPSRQQMVESRFLPYRENMQKGGYIFTILE